MPKLNKGKKMQYIINIKSITGELEYTEIFENLNDANNQLDLLKECKADKIITLTESKGNSMRDGRKARSSEESANYRNDAIAQYKKAIEIEEVKEINHNTFEYKGNKVFCYGEASEFNNMAIEGWIRDEEYSVIYSEGYNSYKKAVKAVVNDTIKIYGVNCLIEQIEFV